MGGEKLNATLSKGFFRVSKLKDDYFKGLKLSVAVHFHPPRKFVNCDNM